MGAQVVEPAGAKQRNAEHLLCARRTDLSLAEHGEDALEFTAHPQRAQRRRHRFAKHRIAKAQAEMGDLLIGASDAEFDPGIGCLARIPRGAGHVLRLAFPPPRR